MNHIIENIRSIFVKNPMEKEIEKSIKELNSYSDAELTDLGISRLCIEECVRGNAANTYLKAG